MDQKKKYFLLLLICYLLFSPFLCRASLSQDQQNSSFLDLDHSIWESILKTYSKNGTIDYLALKKNRAQLNQYLTALRILPPKKLAQLKRMTLDINKKEALLRLKGQRLEPNKKLPKYEWMALWINAYNAFVTLLVIDHFPIQSVKEIQNFWNLTQSVPGKKGIKLQVGNQQMSLKKIRDTILRREGDPRVYLFLSNAARGDSIPIQALYPTPGFESTLEQKVREAFSRKKHYFLDRKNKILYYSSVLDWYKKDFTKRYGSLIGQIKSYVPLIDEQFIDYEVTDAKCRISSFSKIFFGCVRSIPFDWSLNDERVSSAALPLSLFAATY